MNWIAWIALSNVGIFILEYIYRTSRYDSFIGALPIIIIPIFIGQIGLFYGFRTAPSLLLAGATFTLMNVALRVINTYSIGETINVYNWAGVVLLVIAMFLIKVK